MQNFYSIHSHSFTRTAACTLPAAMGDPCENARRTAELAHECSEKSVAVAVFPELGLTGYPIEDLLLQDVLLDATPEAFEDLWAASVATASVIVVGAPLVHRGRVFNCVAAIHCGHVLGVVPKSYLPDHREFYERRHLVFGEECAGKRIALLGVIVIDTVLVADEVGDDFAASDSLALYDVSPETVPFGPGLLLEAEDVRGLTFHVEVYENMWVPVPPLVRTALTGASLLLNLSGSPITVGRASDRELPIQPASSRCNAAYVYAANGEGESSIDLVWDGRTAIYELGRKLASGPHFATGPYVTIADVDLDLLRQERQRQGSFDDNKHTLGIGRRDDPWRDEVKRYRGAFRTVHFTLSPTADDIGFMRPAHRFPFVPEDSTRLHQDCHEAYNTQVSALCQRLRAIDRPKIAIGVSGGLDSTHAFITVAKAMDKLGRLREDILAYTLSGFATSEETKANAYALGESLGVTFSEIDIRPAALQMLKGMGHSFGRGEEAYDVAFENVRAGLRTDYSFCLANANGGIVLGTGGLSEFTLGWCTLGAGDHISHYNVNAGAPKTLIQHLVRWVTSSWQFGDSIAAMLRSILNTEISPELIPAKDGEQIQSTQTVIGPYELQDFTLFYVLHRGSVPSKIALYVWHSRHDADGGAWPEGIAEADRRSYGVGETEEWMEVFYKRLFSNQFRRSTLSNGSKASMGGALFPRGDWRMPSDTVVRAWLAEMAAIPDGGRPVHSRLRAGGGAGSRRRGGFPPLSEWNAQLSRIEYRYRGCLDVKSRSDAYRVKTLKEKQSKGRHMPVKSVAEVEPGLLEAVNGLIPQLSSSTPSPNDKQLDEFLSQPATYLFVCEDVPTGAEDDSSRILGMFTFATLVIPTDKRAWIEDVVVDPAARGQGAGRALVEAAIAHAKQIGVKSVDLTSRPSRKAVNRLYTRSGFAARQTSVYCYGD